MVEDIQSNVWPNYDKYALWPMKMIENNFEN